MQTLTLQQKEAIETTEGRLLILAGAGSGKTRVIVQRIAYLIKDQKVAPEKILGLTFTNKAAHEMQVRLRSLIDSKTAERVLLCTFHSFCMQVLREHIHHLGYTSSFSLYDEKDRLRLITNLTKEILKTEKELPSLSPTVDHITKVKNDLISLDTLDPLSKEIYLETEKAMRAYNALDFDSLIPLCITLFKEQKKVLEKYQQRFAYLMIDEYQDTNPCQNTLAEMLCKKTQNICVVGDDDQAIYSWRGAKVDHILQFKADRVIKLEQNFRSTTNIIKGAYALISRNKKRHEKHLFSQEPKIAPIKVFFAPNEEQEAKAIVSKLCFLKNTYALEWKDIAILYRSNILSRSIEMALLQATWKNNNQWVRSIPYKIYGGLEFNQRAEIKDIFSYLRFLVNPQDTEALLRICNVPRRGISNQTIDLLTTYQRKNKISLWQVMQNPPQHLGLSKKGLLGLKNFRLLIEKGRTYFSTKPLDIAFSLFLQECDYKKAIIEDVKSEKMQIFKWENIQSIYISLQQYQKKEKKPSLSHFLTTCILTNDKEPFKKKEREENTVSLMTLHSAKGLEFTACFIMGLEDHLIPHEKSLLDTGLEEERRLFYVGLTRAKKFLTLSMAQKRMSMGKQKPTIPSRFLFEIPKKHYQVTSYTQEE